MAVMVGCAVFDGVGFGVYLRVFVGVGFGFGFGVYLCVFDGVGFGFGVYLCVFDGDGFGECLVVVVGDGLVVVVGAGAVVVVFDGSDADVEGVAAGAAGCWDPVAAIAVPPAVPPDSRAAVRVPTAKVRPQWLRNVSFTMFSHLEQLHHWSLSASTEVRSVPPDRRPEQTGSHFQQKWQMPVRRNRSPQGVAG
ncbi:hypothetical protein ACFWA5_43305 [Streptomyces mirabilis]|uniref:hypothetical protein n=1 Tax=Streptomyces mirabilis TaxID=68239 RepID=UPI0036657867